MIHHYVDGARTHENFSAVRQVGMDETASRRGHQSVSLRVDTWSGRKYSLRRQAQTPDGTVEDFTADLAGAPRTAYAGDRGGL